MTTTAAPKKKSGFVAGTANYLDERVGLGSVVKGFGRKVFPDHWSFMLGEVALYSFVITVITGTFLTFFYNPSMAPTIYEGAYAPLKGVQMTVAYSSTLDISFEVRGGLLMRQVHHWAALLFVAAVGLHMLRVFFTGAFRKPRELNWVVGFLLFIMAMAAGFTGYSLPDDLLSGNGLRIIDGMIKGFPLVGPAMSSGLFGGEFPGDQVIQRMYALHIMIVPALIIVLIALHLMMVILHKHTHYSGPGRTDSNVVGYPLMPVYVAKAGGFFFIVFGVLMAISATFTINPIWNYGPYDPSPVGAGTQPDWYIGWLDGALRLAPSNWDITIAGYVYPMGVLVPTVISLVFLAAVAVYPFLENWVTGDKREHHVLDRPRNAPTRTAIGAAGVTFYAVLWAGASTDLIAIQFQMSLNHVLIAMQILLLIGPFIAYWVTKRTCLSLQRKDREVVLHGRETGRVLRLPHGEFVEIHEPVDKYELWKLVDFKDYEPIMPRPNAQGKITIAARVRSAISRMYFEDRIAPVTKAEYELAQAHGDHSPEPVAKKPVKKQLTKK
jgi:ubiquinol-cytochrome c reductase cytochrome b subunit